MSGRSRGWVFTLNNPSEDDNPKTLLEPHSQWGIAQLEVGENGTEHWQGYVYFSSAKTFTAVKRLLRRGHIERRRGSHSDAKEYCSKEDTRKAGCVPVSWGDVEPQQGKRNDLSAVKELIDNGAEEEIIADEHFGSWVRYHKAFRAYRSLKIPQRNHVTHTTVYWGEPGTGKTRRVFEEAGPDAYWLPKPNGTRCFWDGYTGQENVCIDEFFGWMPRDLMCRICDRYVFCFVYVC